LTTTPLHNRFVRGFENPLLAQPCVEDVINVDEKETDETEGTEGL